MQQNEGLKLEPVQGTTFPRTISFQDFESSPAVTADIERYIAKLEKFSDRIVSCHVSIRSPQKSKRKHIFQINIQVNMPGEPIIVTREPTTDYDHADAHLAVRDAFKAVERQLRERHSRLTTHARPEDPVAARVEAESSLEIEEPAI